MFGNFWVNDEEYTKYKDMIIERDFRGTTEWVGMCMWGVSGSEFIHEDGWEAE